MQSPLRGYERLWGNKEMERDEDQRPSIWLTIVNSTLVIRGGEVTKVNSECLVCIRHCPNKRYKGKGRKIKLY